MTIRFIISAVAVGAACIGGAAAGVVTFDLTSTSNGSIVYPGQPIPWSISVHVSQGDNAGLALACVDLRQEFDNPEFIEIPPAIEAAIPAEMSNFSVPTGISNPGENGNTTGYVGVQRGETGYLDLVQIGGAQNTFGVAGVRMGLSTQVVGAIGQGPQGQLLAQGTITAPATPGAYSFTIHDPLANTLVAINVAPMTSPTEAAAAAIDSSTITFTVAAPTPVLYVNTLAPPGGDGSSWATAMNELRDALAVAANPLAGVQEIWTAAGTYRPAAAGGSRSASFVIPDGVAVYGGFAGSETSSDQRNPQANVTELSGDLNGDDSGPSNLADNAFHVVTLTEAGPATILDGFTIRAGVADAATAPNDRGGNILFSAGSPRIEACVIEDGRALRGGGIYMDNAAQPVFANCGVLDNSAIGNCGNCGGGGLYAEFGCAPRLVNCEFAGNHADASNGGGVFLRDNPNPDGALLVNCYIRDNSANAGGGICIALADSATVVNCTVVNNAATQFGGGVFVFRCNPTFSNSVFWGDQSSLGAEFAIPFCPSHPLVQYCDIAGGEGAMYLGAPAPGGDCTPSIGAGLLDSDPLLAGNGDLTDGSPCIDAGSSALLPTDVADLDADGNASEPTPLDYLMRARVWNAQVDIGAFESQTLTGACCIDAVCIDAVTAVRCGQLGGVYQGDAVTCQNVFCDVSPCNTGNAADSNCDGAVNNFDIDCFVAAIVGGEFFWDIQGCRHNGCEFYCVNDTNGDGAVNNFDIDPFVTCLVNGGCQ